MRAATRLLVALLLLGTAANTRAQLSESDVKAAYLLNFARFVEWPARTFAGPEAPFQICLIGDDALGDSLDALTSQRVANRALQIRRVDTAEQAARCQILYVGGAVEGRIASLLDALSRSPVLTVASGEEFARRHGMIGLVTRQGRVRMQIHDGRATRAGLALGTRLIEIAERRYPDRGESD
jgi:hypothetical protein